MILDSINDLPKFQNLGIIINASTKYVTTLALLSWVKKSQIPVLVIDCDSTDGSYEHFCNLKNDYHFYLAKLPLQLHGCTLDYLFKELDAENLFLIDSDTELIDSSIIDFMLKYINKPSVFGAGFIHEGCWLTPESKIPDMDYGYYSTRMWIPFTCLKRSKVLEAFEANLSFLDTIENNDFCPSINISNWLSKRHKVPYLKGSKLSFLNPYKKTINGQKPSYIIYDTGAKIYEFLKQQKGYDFVGTPATMADDFVLHFHGVTRAVLNANDTNSYHFSTYEEIIHKLKENFNIVFKE